MRSIRLSLILYFLVLLGAALGAASFFVYEITRRNLIEHKEHIAAFLKDQYKDRQDLARSKLDQELSSQSKALAALAQYQIQPDRARHHLTYYPLGVLSVAGSVQPQLLIPTWIMTVRDRENREVRNLIADWVFFKIHTKVGFNEELLVHDAEKTGTQYFQISTEWGNTWHSGSLGGREFGVDARAFGRMPFFKEVYDDYKLDEGLVVRRLSVKVPVAMTLFVSEPGFSGGGQSSRDRQPRGNVPERPPVGLQRPPAPPPREVPSRAFFIQCACDTIQRDEELAALANEHTRELADLEDASSAKLSELRERLVIITLVTFAAAVAGGYWIVRLGLMPLRRMGEAVSRVSTKDFELKLEDPRIPVELQPIADRLAGTLDQLKRAFLREKQAAADISHELRTPLAALLTTTEVGLRKSRSPEEYRELLQDCRASGQQMNLLVERLLALARLDAGVDTLRPAQVDVADLAEQCAALVRPLAQARDLNLKVHTQGAAVMKADPNKLREVLTNLLHNAIEYNRPNGSVDLAVERENGSLHVRVRDTGIGIAPDACQHIFERFYRADPSRHSEGMHAGLGLAIVKGYVDLMGGSIDVDSQVGKGSTFHVQLPVC